mmetsp:Transcript_1917/g.7302  ORF Transcript_1917/g.7302 Transcript_1917/m.7302 type:complete len:543 (-) Transcript_1917:4704-6332(-)
MEVLALMESNLEFVRKSTYAVVASRLANFQQVELLEAMLTRMWQRNQEKSMPDERMCALAVNAAFSIRRSDVALRILEGMRAEGVEVGALTVSVMAKGYGRMKQPSAVTELLNSAQQRNVDLDIVAWNSAVDAYTRCGQLDKAHELVEQMKAQKVHPNETTFNTLIKGAGRAGQIDAAFDYLSEMRRNACRPNHVTKNSLIDACMRVGLWDRAIEILDQMLEEESERKLALIGYTSVCAGLVKCGRETDALGLMSEMESKGVDPDPAAYSSVINSLIGVGNIDIAWNLFDIAIERFEDDEEIYATMVAGLCKTGKAKFVYQAAELLEHIDSVSTHNAVVDGFAKIGRLAEAEDCIKFMRQRLVQPNVVTYTALIDGYGRSRDIENGLRLFREMCNEGVAPDLIAFNALISSLVRCGCVVLAMQLFEEMSARKGAITPDFKTYSILAQAHFYDGYFEKGWEIFGMMTDGGHKPNQRMLESILKRVLKSSKPDRDTVSRLLEEMTSAGVTDSTMRFWRMQASKTLSRWEISGNKNAEEKQRNNP